MRAIFSNPLLWMLMFVLVCALFSVQHTVENKVYAVSYADVQSIHKYIHKGFFMVGGERILINEDYIESAMNIKEGDTIKVSVKKTALGASYYLNY